MKLDSKMGSTAVSINDPETRSTISSNELIPVRWVQFYSEYKLIFFLGLFSKNGIHSIDRCQVNLSNFIVDYIDHLTFGIGHCLHSKQEYGSLWIWNRR